GILAIRAAVASGVNITYKILYNDAVAMTGGQPVDGQLSVQQIAHQLAAEGVSRIVVVSDEPEKYGGTGFPTDVDIHHRDRLDEIQRDLREVSGVTILIYDQTCAAEKRRRPKRDKGAVERFAALPEPALPAIGEPYGILVTGVGGTGVVTIGALLGMAAHLEGKGVSVLDMTGLAQKGGAVFSHVRIANRPEDIHAVRIAAGDADLLIGCDIVVAASPDGLAKLRRG